MASLIRDIYRDISADPNNDRLWKTNIWEGPSQSDIAAWEAQGYGVYQGKIRTVLSRDGRIQMLHSDRLTAFDRFIDFVPCKGAILTAISKYWLLEAAKVIPTHFIKEMGPRALITESLHPIKIEVVVRGYLAGSLLRSYQSGERLFCGVRLPDGLNPHDRLPEPIITPTTKAAPFEHDEHLSVDNVIAKQLCTKSEWEQISAMALKLFSLGTKRCQELGWILVDTKYEFGRSFASGEIKLIDELHTPDSSRLWIFETYDAKLKNNEAPEMLDKENLRQWLIKNEFSGQGDVPKVPRALLLELGVQYLKVAEALIGKPLVV